MIADNELTGESLSQTINEIMDDEELQKQMCRASKEQGIPDASKRLYDVVCFCNSSSSMISLIV